MAKQQICGVEKLSGEPQSGAAGSPAVDGVATDGVADRREVRSDRVGAARAEPYAQQRGARQLLLDLEVRDRIARLVCARRHHRPRTAIAADRRVDRPAAGIWAAVDQREVLALDVAPAQRVLQL